MAAASATAPTSMSGLGPWRSTSGPTMTPDMPLTAFAPRGRDREGRDGPAHVLRDGAEEDAHRREAGADGHEGADDSAADHVPAVEDAWPRRGRAGGHLSILLAAPVPFACIIAPRRVARGSTAAPGARCGDDDATRRPAGDRPDAGDGRTVLHAPARRLRRRRHQDRAARGRPLAPHAAVPPGRARPRALRPFHVPQHQQAQRRARPQDRRGPRRPAAARAGRRRGDRELPARHPRTPRDRLRRAARGEPDGRADLAHELRAGRAVPRLRGDRPHDLPGWVATSSPPATTTWDPRRRRDA